MPIEKFTRSALDSPCDVMDGAGLFYGHCHQRQNTKSNVRCRNSTVDVAYDLTARAIRGYGPAQGQ